MNIDQVLTNNVSAIVVAGMFLWYLNKRDNSMEKTFMLLGEKLEQLSEVISSLDNRLRKIEESRKKK